MTSEQLREIEAEVMDIHGFIETQRQLFKGADWWREKAPGIISTNHAVTLLSEVRRLRHQCMECECFGKKPTPCEYAKNGPGMTVEAKGD